MNGERVAVATVVAVIALAWPAIAAGARTGPADGGVKPGGLHAGSSADDHLRQNHWVGTWAAGPQANFLFIDAPGFTNQTVRQVVHTSIAGRVIRVRLTNAHGAAPLAIGSAHVALRRSGASIAPGTDRVLTFSGEPSVTIAPGAPAFSDPVRLNVPAQADLAISLYLPGPTGPPTMHAFSWQTNYTSPAGDFTGAPDMPLAATRYCIELGSRPCMTPWYFLAGVDVMADRRTHAVVALGDSTTDGDAPAADAAALDMNQRWTDFLARRLRARHRAIGVLNQGISGNSVLQSGFGDSALARLDRDVLAQPGARWLIVLEGLVDIIFIAPEDSVPSVPARLIAAHKQIIERAHTRGLEVYGATLTPAGATGAREQARQTVNQWIRTSGAYDAVIDFDAATRDPQDPARLRPAHDGGDGLHPSSAGYEAMANAVNLKLFTRKNRGWAAAPRTGLASTSARTRYTARAHMSEPGDGSGVSRPTTTLPRPRHGSLVALGHKRGTGGM